MNPSVRRHPIVERLQSAIRRTSIIHMDGEMYRAGPGDIIIDGGANIGDITSRFARTGATVHAFEPHPGCYRTIARRFRFTPNVRCHHAGLMDRDCTLDLHTPSPHGTFDREQVTVAASFVEQPSDDYILESATVPCIDLAAFIRKVGRVRLLKLDIEGSEVAVLNALIDSGAIDMVDHAIVETHERFSDELARGTQALRGRIAAAGLSDKINLEWH